MANPGPEWTRKVTLHDNQGSLRFQVILPKISHIMIDADTHCPPLILTRIWKITCDLGEPTKGVDSKIVSPTCEIKARNQEALNVMYSLLLEVPLSMSRSFPSRALWNGAGVSVPPSKATTRIFHAYQSQISPQTSLISELVGNNRDILSLTHHQIFQKEIH